jgi:predicted  nucleic acid-binding Zn-ribbon protein
VIQIEAFVLYHNTRPEPRVLPLQPGLNVLTGWRNTGKSSLIDIVEYCFGGSTLTVSEGKIQRTVAWYGLVLNSHGRFAFSGRPAPTGGYASSSAALFLPLDSAAPPGRDQLKANATVDELRAELSSFAGFADTQFTPPETAARPKLDLHIAHALPVSLQDEEDIDSKSRLFHHGQEREVMQALRDTFPYMVGAAEAETPVLRHRLTELRAAARKIDRELERLSAAGQESDERAMTLLVLAGEVGLAQAPDLDEQPPEPTDVLAALRSAAAQDPEGRSSSPPTGEAERLLERRRGLYEQLRTAQRDEALLRDFGADRDAFSAETNEQRARLATIGLLPTDGDSKRCPVCNQVLDVPDHDAAHLIDQLTILDRELEGVSEMAPRTRKALEQAAATTTSLTDQIRTVTQALGDLEAQGRRNRSIQSLSARRARIQGVIEEYLRTTPRELGSRRENLAEQRATLEAEIEELARQVDSELEQERVDAALSLIGGDMTALARRLHLEHSEGQVRLRLTQTTLVIDTLDGRSFRLQSIGGAGTRVGYHLAAHLAIHRLLRTRNRPTPAFLILDQPTGPFYPEEVPEGEEPQLTQESDRTIVAEIFHLIRSVAEDLDGALQILVTDHATFYGEDWFDSALVEDWRYGKGLIPDEWDRPNDAVD